MEQLDLIVKKIFEKKGYKFFEGNKNINIIGVRSSNKLTNKYDDKLIIIMEINGATRTWVWDDFTTVPGKYYVEQKLLNKDGCAILKPGQYRGMFRIGMHRGKYQALVQNGPCTVYRDSDRDKEIDTDKEDTGIFGINLHHGYDSEDIDRNSAGCQVLSQDSDLELLLRLCKYNVETYGPTMTYTLLEEKDFKFRKGWMASIREFFGK